MTPREARVKSGTSDEERFAANVPRDLFHCMHGTTDKRADSQRAARTATDWKRVAPGEPRFWNSVGCSASCVVSRFTNHAEAGRIGVSLRWLRYGTQSTTIPVRLALDRWALGSPCRFDSPPVGNRSMHLASHRMLFAASPSLGSSPHRFQTDAVDGCKPVASGRRCLRFASVMLVLLSGWLGWAAGGHPMAAVSAAEPIKVYILAGQSNMEGTGFIAADPARNGGKGSLEFVAKDPATAPRFRHLLDAGGKWVVRDDVWISYLDRQGALTVGYGARPDRIGPELGFGVVVGDATEAPVLLVKCAWGGKSLAVDFRPPSAGPVPYSLGEKTDEAIKQDPQLVGKYYRETLTRVKTAVANIGALVPGAAGRGHVLAGFGWHQGWNDRINDKHNAAYEENMAHFIRDMRRDLGAPKLPIVIAETGMNGPTETHPRALSLMKAQAAVATRAEFQGNVAFVPTRSFWRAQDQSPTGQGYHWNTNAETYYLIGDAMGRVMLELSPKAAK
jgi:hypothetical protein